MSSAAETQNKTTVLLRSSTVLSGLLGAAGVSLLALSAHSQAGELLKTAAQMMLFHTPVILAIGILSQVRRVILAPVAMILLTIGILLFSGDLAARALLDHRLFAMAAPTGGVLTIAGWLTLAISAVRMRPAKPS